MKQLQSISNWQVLVVDDEPDSLEAVTFVLGFHGAIVYAASNGREALAILQTADPTLVLTDLSMPMMDGWALLSHIRKTPDLASLPVIALTAHAMRGDAERALAAGFNGYLTKPLSISSLIDDIHERLGAMITASTASRPSAHIVR